MQQAGADEKKEAAKLQLSDEEEEEGQVEGADGKKKVVDAKTVLLREDCQLSMSLSFL